MWVILSITQIHHAIATPPLVPRSSSRKSVGGTAHNYFISQHALLLFNIFTDDRIVLRTPHSVYALRPDEAMVIALLYSTAFYSSDGEALDSLPTLSSRQTTGVDPHNQRIEVCAEHLCGKFRRGDA